jgi:hypothetical protein
MYTHCEDVLGEAPHICLAHWAKTVLIIIFALSSAQAQQAFDPGRGILLHGTVVTMDGAGTILHNASVLVRSGKIVATWQGADAPDGVPMDNAVVINLGPNALIFPGLINLHNHPTFDLLPLWPTPSSHVEASLGRPLGTEPYANRYQWNKHRRSSSLTGPH